jgi:dynein heavy chain
MHRTSLTIVIHPAQEFKPLAKPMVDSTVSIFLRIQNELLPTPAKSHYTFNLRDVSRVFQV